MDNLKLILALRERLRKQIIGQSSLVDRLLIALLADGHLLVEGAPGLAKTRAIRALAEGVEGEFHRVQFTPDLLPADLTGTEIFRPATADFEFQQGPLFHHFVLADEINRAPAKVQSALLEAMAERQITVGMKTYTLPDPFLVMATQNPIEQEGTYSLPEAQLDRFLMHVLVDYPAASVERDILRLVRNEALNAFKQSQSVETEKSIAKVDTVRLPLSVLSQARGEVLQVHSADSLEDYMVRLVTATRDSGHPNIDKYLACGASPRATLALDACARAHAWLSERDYVVPGDIQAVLHDVLRHRLILSYQAEAEGISADVLIERLLQHVAVP